MSNMFCSSSAEIAMPWGGFDRVFVNLTVPRIRILVKHILPKYGYPPDLQDAAVQTVLQQAEVLSARWAA